MKFKGLFLCFLMGAFVWSCNEDSSEKSVVAAEETSFEYLVEQFADIQILRYQIPGFNELSLDQKKLVYYLITGRIGRKGYYVGSELPT